LLAIHLSSGFREQAGRLLVHGQNRKKCIQPAVSRTIYVEMTTRPSPDGKTLASGSMANTVRLWDVATGKERAALRGHTLVVATVAFSPDGKALASGSADRSIKLWDMQAR
jgi:WD40 repeat protein